MKFVKFAFLPIGLVLAAMVYAAYSTQTLVSNTLIESYAGVVSADGTVFAYREDLGTSSQIIVKNTSSGVCDCSDGLTHVSRPSISKDGKYVAFYGTDSSGYLQPYLCEIDFNNTPVPTDLWSGTATQGTAHPGLPLIAVSNEIANGPYVAFGDVHERTGSSSTVCGEIDPDNYQIWLWYDGSIVANASAKSDGAKPCYGGHQPTIWAKENQEADEITVMVGYRSYSWDLPGYNNYYGQIYLTTFVNNGFVSTELISSVSGNGANNHSETPDLSDDGLMIAYASEATDLVSGDTNLVKDIFVHRISDGSRSIPYDGNDTGTILDWHCHNPKIMLSSNVRNVYYVAFGSFSKTLDPDTNIVYEGMHPYAYITNTSTKVAKVVSLNYTGTGNKTRRGDLPTISTDAAVCVFSSTDNDIASGASGTNSKVFRLSGGP